MGSYSSSATLLSPRQQISVSCFPAVLNVVALLCTAAHRTRSAHHGRGRLDLERDHQREIRQFVFCVSQPGSSSACAFEHNRVESRCVQGLLRRCSVQWIFYWSLKHLLSSYANCSFVSFIFKPSNSFFIGCRLRERRRKTCINSTYSK